MSFIQGPKTRYGNLVRKMCVVFNLRLLKKDDIYIVFSSLEEAALKLINVLNAAPGSVWYFTPNQLQPANLPDYVLPKVLPPKTTMQPFGIFGVNYGMGGTKR